MNVELKEGPEDRQITGLRSGTLDVCIGHLSRTYDQIENMLLIRERLVVALPNGHSAARNRYVGFRDLEGELLIMPSKDSLPSPHPMIAAAAAFSETDSGLLLSMLCQTVAQALEAFRFSGNVTANQSE
jgi:DNA-binding transcriptional LysR family regulator